MKKNKNENLLPSYLPESEMTEELKDARAEINRILKSCSARCSVEFYDDAAKIRSSYLIRSGSIRRRICSLLIESGITCRSAENLSAEWLLHNICYALHIKRSSAADVDLDYTHDRRLSVRLATKIMAILNME